ncbi:hypothetical protein [Clostridium perfringens]|uniref:hypothetical protein n=1 Tax=Clostridium perfringens TaxID=1502 RepID=UPI00096A63D7|nr:hypothetical protein [Clostridium perfringens]
MMYETLGFDKENKQEDFQYMARSVENNKLTIGYMVVEKPWCSPESMWKYYIISNKYVGGFCGGATNAGFEKELVDKDTIKPFNQTAKVIYNQEANIETYIIDSNGNTIATINPNDDIPYELWE